MVGDESQVVPAVIGEVSGVEAEVRVALIGEFEEALDLRMRADMRIGVGMELLVETELLLQALPRRRGRRPCAPTDSSSRVRGSRAWPVVSERHSSGMTTMCSPPSSAVSFATALGLCSRPDRTGRPGLVESREHSAAGEFESSGCELLTQLVRVRGQVAVGTELDPRVPGLDHLVEEALPGDLAGMVGQPDAPGVGGGADAK
jgi:hypothetical protein